MLSNNGKTFKSAAKSLEGLFLVDEVAARLADRQVKWRFNVEKAPWWGGFLNKWCGPLSDASRI